MKKVTLKEVIQEVTGAAGRFLYTGLLVFTGIGLWFGGSPERAISG